MAITEAQKFKLKKIIKELEPHRGRHTELVSVYIPAGYDLNKIINHLVQEQGTASNIKSTSTRKNVIDALERMIQHLRIYKSTPEHGLAVFSGNVAEREGQSDVRVWSIEPPIPLKTRIYRCDKEFQLDILRDMLEIKELYGLVVMDRREANIAFLKGKTIVELSNAQSNVPGKTRAGGQSAHRFERIREGEAKAFYNKIAEMMKEQYLPVLTDLKGIIVGGPGPTKYEFVDGGYITDQLKRKIIAIKDLSYTGSFGLQELLDKSADVLAGEEIAGEKKVMGKFFDLLAKQPNKVAYGIDFVKNHLSTGIVDVVLISEDYDEKEIDWISQEAQKFNTQVMIISTETREGVQLKNIGGVAAILRYEVH